MAPVEGDRVPNDPLAGRVYLTQSFISAKPSSDEAARSALAFLAKDERAEGRFEDAYTDAWRTLFNPVLSSRLSAAYLGYLRVPADDHGYDDVGKIRCDFVLVRNKYFETSTINVHYLLEHNQYALESDGYEPLTRTLIRLSRHCYRGDIPGRPDGLRDIKHALRIMDSEGDRICPLRSVYISLCAQKKEVVEDWGSQAERIYRLLWMHSGGTSDKLALEFLKGRTWTSAAFYRNFHQPGATLSISYPYPDIYEDYPSYFLPTLERINKPVVGPMGTEVDQPVMPGYDYLPEYPPLRYLGLPLLDHVGSIEEVMRDVQDELQKVYDASWWWRGIRAAVEGSRVRAAYHRLANLDALKLPVTREYVGILLEEKMLTPADRTVQRMQESLVQQLLTVIAIATVVMMVFTVVEGVAQWFLH